MRARWSRSPTVLLVLTLAAVAPSPASAQVAPAAAPLVAPPYGQTVVQVALQVTGHPDYPQSLLLLLDVKPNQPLTREGWRSAVQLLVRLGRFEAVRVDSRPVDGGVAVTFVAEPRHPITDLDFRGAPALAGDLRRRVLEAYGAMPADAPPGVIEDLVVEALHDEGYLQASAPVQVEPFTNPDRATLVFDITLGPRTMIGRVRIVNANPAAVPDARLVQDTGAVRGEPFRPVALRAGLTRAVKRLKQSGYYTAGAEPFVATPAGNGTVDVTLTIDPGPLVVLRWERNGQAPSGDINDYVPVRQQESVDEDLLDDSGTRIATLLRSQGYQQARVTHAARREGALETITYTVVRGPKFFVDAVQIPSGLHMSDRDIRRLLDIAPGDVFDQQRVQAGVDAVRTEYQVRGYYDATVVAVPKPSPARPSTARKAWDVLALAITEGPKGESAMVAFDRATSQIPEADLRQVIDAIRLPPFSSAMPDAMATAVKALYDNRGYRNAVVNVTQSFSADQHTVTRTIHVDEHQLVRVLDITVIGWHDISERAIREEMALHPGEAFSAALQIESQRKIYDMGVFRSVSVQPLDPLGPNDAGVHLIVRVVESPDTTIQYGGDIEAGNKERTTVTGLVSRLEFSPRGFFSIARQNLGGRNRILALFLRLSLRPRDAPGDPVHDGHGYTFGEYRVAITYRERRAFSTHTDVTVGLSAEQAIRATFNFRRQDANIELFRGLKPHLAATLRYTLDFTQLYDQTYLTSDPSVAEPIDRVFPQVRLSIFSFSLLSDHRDDAVSPSRGVLASADSEAAMRAVGSEVGYVKTFLQASTYHRVTSGKRVIAAVRAEVGLAHGFPRQVTDSTGAIETVADLPASQRFFAGGSTTVRGFPLDQLGTPAVITNQGISVGGNGLVVLNAELRTTIGKLFHHDFGIVQFIDAGNVFAKVHDIALDQLRSSAGVGLRYDSPLGPLRLDFGFKLGRHVVAGALESAWEYHLSFGQAF